MRQPYFCTVEISETPGVLHYDVSVVRIPGVAELLEADTPAHHRFTLCDVPLRDLNEALIRTWLADVGSGPGWWVVDYATYVRDKQNNI